MLFYNFILKHFILPIGDRFLGGNYLKNIKAWYAYDKKSEAELLSIQRENLKDILVYARENVPFYANQDSSSLSSFPILTKTILREQASSLISIEFDISKLDKHHSSGSSGVQSFTYMTDEHKFYLRALQTHWWGWSGYQVGDPLLQFGISQRRSFVKQLKDLFYRCDYVKAFGLSDMELRQILKRLSKRKQVYIAGYPSVVNQLAKAKLEPHTYTNIKGVICFGDKLFDHYKSNIYKAFGNELKLIDTYGCAEGLLMACKYDLDYYYIMSPHVYIEIVNEDGSPVADGIMGHVLVTCLTNKAMPLIRYKLGDLAIKLPKEDYPDRRLLNYPLLQKVVGRETDIVKTSKGITLNVHSFTGVLEYYQDIKQYKIIQNELDTIIIEYIPNSPNNPVSIAVLEEITAKFHELTNHCLKLEFKAVKSISSSPSGKPQIIESNLRSQ